MSIDLVHDDVEKDLIKVTLKQQCEYTHCVTSGAKLIKEIRCGYLY